MDSSRSSSASMNSSDSLKGEEKETDISSNISEIHYDYNLEKNTGADSKATGRGRVRKKRQQKASKQCSDHEEQLISKLTEMTLQTSSHIQPVTATGLATDVIMEQHECLWLPDHQEGPMRLRACVDRCAQLQLTPRCTLLPTRYATEDQVLLQHSHGYLETIKSSTTMDEEGLRSIAARFPDVYFNQMTYECALVSLGCTLEVTESIITEKVRNGFALVRPPGHHAQNDISCGYCIFNNVSIAAKYALEEFHLERILIVDWDVHHGQGTQDMFYDDPRVLVMSIHRYDNGEYWPNLRRSDYDYTGGGSGAGYNINIPLNQVGLTISDYMAIFQQIVTPVAYEFEPQLVFVSAGYDSALGCPEFSPNLVLVSCGMDSALGDPKGEMCLEPSAYPHLLHGLRSIAEGRVCCVLEGGYCVKSLAESTALTLRELLGDPCPLIGPTQPPCDSICATILNVIKVHRHFWQCFQYQDPDDTLPCPYPEVNMTPPRPDVIFDDEIAPPGGYSLERDDNFVSDERRMELDECLDRLIAETDLSTPAYRTGFAFDPDMRAHKNVTMPNHPECADRISRIFEYHVETGLYTRCHKMQESYSCACLATGCVLNLVDSVLTGETLNGVAVVRPPGHHAEAQVAMGFCLFNTVAIAAQYARTKHAAQRVLIVDWDIHHGNGTQHAFQDDPSVLFISLHRYENGLFYPGSDDANYERVGIGSGMGFTINIPWNYQKMGDSEYIAAFQQIIMPIAYQFCPDLVLVSAGFDAARGDPLGGYNVTPEGYAHMTHMLSSLAGGKLILVLEGGYNLTSISLSMAACTGILLGDPCPTLAYTPPNNSAVLTIRHVIAALQPYWSCLKFFVPLPGPCVSDTSTDNFADVSTLDDGSSDRHLKHGRPHEGRPTSDRDGRSFDNSTPLKNPPQIHHHQPRVPFSCPDENSKTPYGHDVKDSRIDRDLDWMSGDKDSVTKDIDSQTSDSSHDQSLIMGRNHSSLEEISPGRCNFDSFTDELIKNLPKDFNQSSIYEDDDGKFVTGSKKSSLESPQVLGDNDDHSKSEQTRETYVVCNETASFNNIETKLPQRRTEHSSKPSETVCLSSVDVVMPEEASGSREMHTIAHPVEPLGDCLTNEILGACGGSDPQPIFLGYLQEGTEGMYAVEPLRWCPHLSAVAPVPQSGLDAYAPCIDCGYVGENWVCLECHSVGCSRYINEHMLRHGEMTGHHVVLSYADISVWCYICDSYLDNPVLDPVTAAACESKFGTRS